VPFSVANCEKLPEGIPSRCHPPLCKDLRQHFTVAALMARDEGQGAFHGGLDRSVGDVKGAHQSPEGNGHKPPME